jgi:hypothetical protein
MMMRMRKMSLLRTILTVAGVSILSLSGARGVQAQALFGAEVLFGTETDVGIGGRVHVDLGSGVPNLEFQGGFALFFPDGPADYWEINGNVWYRIETRGDSNVLPYVGGGLNIGHHDRDDFEGDTDLGLNLGGGVRFPFQNTTPFLEARFTVGGEEQFIIGGGVLFGGF